ncbi:hypothetical protein JAAARDRAFT_36745 [Jaapia argillacea MUCL 33604]|uniref:Ubiquitin carboxyl-terminal hydrolase n=1 Tax=Jaapia argillacea MUCL 33604 TaxID=933084 RepID=A0A067PQ68_9AGAM|nr:hypothetical protein JAAARDRAFT_36745 [Jaapia argillacea MUCL 33604]
MAPIQVSIKHAGKSHSLELDTDQPAGVFKEAVSAVTGVPVERVKVMVKGGVLKDDSDWKKIAPKPGQTFMVVGTATELPKPPPQPTVFLEDLGDQELAEALAMPVGLKNLGNTCYMNATVQAMRAIPELQTALSSTPQTAPLPRAMAELYTAMSRTTSAHIPISFLSTLRQVVPQFGEIDRSKSGFGAGYAQQDAEECWTAVTNALKEVPGVSPTGGPAAKKFVEQYMMGEMQRTLTCDEAPEEPATTSSEKVLKVECNISINTNFMLRGILDSLDQKVEKQSASLGRQAIYNQHSRLSRLPAYLTVHMVRFAWRRDIAKKAKIMRKVKFSTEFDALDLVTDDLKAKLAPVNRKLLDVEKERFERRKVRRRTKGVAAASTSKDGDVEMGDATSSAAPTAAPTTSTEETKAEGAEDKGKGKLEAGELEDESVYRERELKELNALVDEGLKNDVGCSTSGLYELVAIVTHKGAAADAGHYMGFVKKSVFHPELVEEQDDDWYKFDDDKVSVFPKDKLATLDGGGEDSSAYVLLYKTKSLV